MLLFTFNNKNVYVKRKVQKYAFTQDEDSKLWI